MSIAQDSEEQRTGTVSEDREKEDAETSSSTSEGSDVDELDDEDESGDEDDAIAHKLTEQLLEDIRRAREAAVPPAPTTARASPKEEAVLATIKTVLSFATSDPLVQSTFSNTEVPGYPNSNVFEMLSKIAQQGRITPQVAGSLSHVLVKLAKSDVLFRPLPSPQETLKRKRDERTEDNGPREKRTSA